VVKKALFVISLIAIIASVLFLNLDVKASNANSSIDRGGYLHERSLRVTDVRDLPIPKQYEDYAFLQSIDRECNIVVGKFTGGHREIVLYNDRNADGKVDVVTRWLVDKKILKYEPAPEKYCPPEKFKKMKEDIIGGIRRDMNPNPAGTQLLDILFKDSANIRKYDKGYTVTAVNPHVTYYFADRNNRGVDLKIFMKTNHSGHSPVINYGVYCDRSQDKYVITVVKQLVNNAKNTFKNK